MHGSRISRKRPVEATPVKAAGAGALTETLLLVDCPPKFPMALRCGSESKLSASARPLFTASLNGPHRVDRKQNI